MSLNGFLVPANLLQTIVLALSIFNLVTFLWLALTVWLNGDRRTGIARMGVISLGFSALFFFIHSLLISSPIPRPAGFPSLDFLWNILWLPALAVPYLWFAIGLHYAALINEGWRRRRPLLLISSGLLGCTVLALLITYRSSYTFVGTLRLLAYNDLIKDTHGDVFSPLILLPLLFLLYVTFCAIGPWFTLGRVNRLIRACWTMCTQRLGKRKQKDNATFSLRRALANTFWDDPTEVELLEEPVLSWHLARPWLFLAAILMVGLTTILGILGILSLINWIEFERGEVVHIVPQTLTAIPFNLLVLDIIANTAVAFIILIIGYSITRHGILIERPLARRGFFEQWRGIVIVATTVAIFIALLVDLTHSYLGGMLLITSLATIAYALFTWSSYTAHDRYIAMLGPFMHSTNIRHWLNTDQQKTEQGLEDLFFHLCQDVLAVQCARMIVLTGPVRRSFSYRWPDASQIEGERNVLRAKQRPPRNKQNKTPDGENRAPTRIRMTIGGQAMICWVLPIYDELGLVAMLYLGPREDGGVFTDEDMDLAHACGQRILDTLGDHEAMQAVAGLLRRRIVDVKLLGAQQRRVLHDDILPQMHLALLQLETLRSKVNQHTPVPATPRPREQDRQIGQSDSEEKINAGLEPTLDEVVKMITDAHRRLAAMMRATAPGAPHRLERDGLMPAIHTMLNQDFQQAFDEIEWDVSEETANCIDEVTPPAIAELIFAAVQEALRNSARHARGADVHRRLKLTLKATCGREYPFLEVIVADDGVGIISASSSTTGTGGGLLTHSALLAIAGGSLTIKSAPGEGVTVRILLPVEALK
ncbi:MAG TPA: ATP-binding protein [Ktedonobacteraceae bacterium]|nr:ATP-binding protein [Ktedonobacteraceae bacterium]